MRVVKVVAACLLLVSITTCDPDVMDEVCHCVTKDVCSPPHYHVKPDEDYEKCAFPGLVCCVRRPVVAPLLSCGLYKGQNASEVPWMVSIILVNSSTVLGGGSLVHPGYVLTAAHLVTKLRPGSLMLRLAGGEERRVTSVIVHHGYRERLLVNDVALLALDHPVTLSRRVGVVCLPEQLQHFDLASCMFGSWGDKSTLNISGNAGREPHKMAVLPRHQCEEALSLDRALGPWFHLHSSHVCAVSKNPRQRVCKGDGGGPLFCPIGKDFPNYHVQVGVASYGLSCQKEGVTPSVFTQVSRFRDWIDRYLVHFNTRLQPHQL